MLCHGVKNVAKNVVALMCQLVGVTYVMIVLLKTLKKLCIKLEIKKALLMKNTKKEL